VRTVVSSVSAARTFLPSLREYLREFQQIGELASTSQFIHFHELHRAREMPFQYPILPIVAVGEPIEEDHTAQGLPSAAELLGEFREAGIPATVVWVPFESAQHWLVVTIARDWREKTEGTVDELCRRIGAHVFEVLKYGAVIPKVLVMNDDIDATNTSEVVWTFATRCHQGSGEIYFNKESASSLVAFLQTNEKVRRARWCITVCRRKTGETACPIVLPFRTTIQESCKHK
jgi:3-polyprenyl-4-hydroxybenzoate decarboxylase